MDDDIPDTTASRRLPLKYRFKLAPQQITTPTDRYRVFYHATVSHRAEIEWLYPVIATVLEKEPRIDFEIIGDHQTHKLYRKLPRTTVVNPMSWDAYQSFIAQPGRHLGLAPYIHSPFNAARSYTKVFDIQRAGARGTYAEDGPWGRHQDRENMVLLPMVEEAWVDEIFRQARVCLS
jgi:hypothetical protein